MAEKMKSSDLLRAAGEVVWRATRSVIWLLIPILVIGWLAGGIRSAAQWLGARVSPIAALLFMLACGAVWLALLLSISPDRMRNKANKIEPGLAVGLIAAAATLWVYIFGICSWTFLKAGFVTYEFHGAPGTELSNLVDSYLWQLFDMIPALRINEALGWKADVVLDGGSHGIFLILFRVVILYQVFALARKLFKDDAKKEGG